MNFFLPDLEIWGPKRQKPKDTYTTGFWRSIIDSRCKKHQNFIKIPEVNIWSTFGQHLLPKCCLKHHQKNSFLRLFWRNNAFKATFRQQMLPKCWPNVDFRNFQKNCPYYFSFVIIIQKLDTILFVKIWLV